MTTAPPAYAAEIRLPTLNLHDDLPFYEGLGFRLDQIWPADDPAVAIISGHGLRIRLERGAAEAPGTIRLLGDEAREALTAPSGVRVEVAPLVETMEQPATQHLHDPPPDRSGALGDWSGWYELPRPHSRSIGRGDHRLPHPHSG